MTNSAFMTHAELALRFHMKEKGYNWDAMSLLLFALDNPKWTFGEGTMKAQLRILKNTMVRFKIVSE